MNNRNSISTTKTDAQNLKVKANVKAGSIVVHERGGTNHNQIMTRNQTGK